MTRIGRQIGLLDRPKPSFYKPPPTLKAQVAQLVEHAIENRSVGGSIPPLGTIYCSQMFAVVHLLCKINKIVENTFAHNREQRWYLLVLLLVSALAPALR